MKNKKKKPEILMPDEPMLDDHVYVSTVNKKGETIKIEHIDCWCQQHQ